MKNDVFKNVTRRNLVEIYRRFGNIAESSIYYFEILLYFNKFDVSEEPLFCHSQH